MGRLPCLPHNPNATEAQPPPKQPSIPAVVDVTVRADPAKIRKNPCDNLANHQEYRVAERIAVISSSSVHK